MRTCPTGSDENHISPEELSSLIIKIRSQGYVIEKSFDINAQKERWVIDSFDAATILAVDTRRVHYMLQQGTLQGSKVSTRAIKVWFDSLMLHMKKGQSDCWD